MDETKIRLSQKELELITDADIILTKNAVMKKMFLLLEGLQESLQAWLLHEAALPAEVLRSGPKISKGENYQGLPYLVLDQPRHFEINNIFAIRTMFWWGRYFSITIQLSGRYKEDLTSALEGHFDELKKNEYYYCIHEDPWKHHLENDNYIPLMELDQEKMTKLNGQRSFIKLAKKIELKNMDKIHYTLETEYKKLAGMLKTGR